MLEEKDVNNPENVAQEGVEEPTSPVGETQEPEVTETPTPKEGEEPEVTEEQRVPYDRFKDVVEEKNYYKQLLAQQMQHQQQSVVQPPQVQDKYANLPPEEQLFYRRQEEMMRNIAKEIAEEKEKKFNTQLQFFQQRDAQNTVDRFRKEHPDIKAGSYEEHEIADKIKTGYQPNDAYWSVMGPRGVKNAESTAHTKVKQQMQVKKKANVEQSSVQSAGLPQASKSFRQDLASEEFDLD